MKSPSTVPRCPRTIGPEDYPAERVDTIFGSVFGNVISITIIVATAAAIGGTGPLDSAKPAAPALKPVAGGRHPAVRGRAARRLRARNGRPRPDRAFVSSRAS